jgi:hypothetical protein
MGEGCSCGKSGCEHVGKHPRTKHGFHDATTDEAAIRQWWTQWPDANTGIATGATSGLVVLDIDPRHGGGETLVNIERQHGSLPHTVKVRTGGGGQHVYFAHPGGKVKSRTIAPGIDVKADGGYIVAPPSSHASGRRYEWEASSHPDDIALAPPPGWLLDMMRSRASGSRPAPSGEAPEIRDGKRNTTLISLAGTMRRRGMGESAIVAALREENRQRCKPPLPEDEVAKIATSSMRYPSAPGYEGTAADGHDHELPVIYASCQVLPEVTAQCWAALEQANRPPRLFRYGGVLVRLERDDGDAPRLQELGVDRLRHELARAADWRARTRVNDRVIEVPAKPPVDVMRDVLATPEPPLPVLTRIAEVPVIGADGTVHLSPGYHERARFYYAPPKGLVIPEVERNPTPAQASAAVGMILELICDFPFVDDADRAHAVALLLLPFVRDLIDGPTPNHLIEAPTPGCGKGLLAEALLIPAVGRHQGVVAWTSDDDELRKRITAQLREGRTAILFDNVTRSLESGVLAAALTALTWDDRVLGRSETVRVPVRCAWVTTANNPTVSTEIARRSVRMRLDPRTDRPWLRTDFRHPDLRLWAHEHRAKLIWAALTLARYWLAAGRPQPRVRPLGSYEKWTAVIGGILQHVGIAGFLGNLNEFYELADVEGATWRNFVETWWERFGDAEVGTSELFPLALEMDGFELGKGSDRSQRTVLGKQLAKQRDRVIGDCRVLRAGKAGRANRWKLAPASAQAACPPESGERGEHQ